METGDARTPIGQGSGARAPIVRRPLERRGARLAGVGGYLPDRVVTNEELGEQLGVDAHWIQKRTLIEQRRYADDMRVDVMASHAGRAALEDARIDPAEVDLVVVAGDTPDDHLPPTSPQVNLALGTVNASAYDIHAACVGWLHGVDAAAGLIEAHRAECVLVIGVQNINRYLDSMDKATVPVMADGAGAAVFVAAEGDGYIQTMVRGADGAYAHLVRAGLDDRIFRMEGIETFKQAIDALVDSSREILDACGLTTDDIDLFCYHQANGRILRRVVAGLKLPPEKVIEAIRLVGNTGPASIPLALSRSQAEGRLENGQRILLGAVGAGAIWGSTLIEWQR